jgi:phosphoenolpyruvate carboxykinase (ATP)
VTKLSPEQAMYYFLNGYTSKLAGTEAGVKEPQPNFSACFGGPFLPRPAMVYAQMLADRVKKHNADVWLLNTGWTGGPYGVGERFKLAYTRAFVRAILDGSLKGVKCEPDAVFGLPIPAEVPGVPWRLLKPRNAWASGVEYDRRAKDLAAKFRDNDKKFDMPENVRSAGPRG